MAIEDFDNISLVVSPDIKLSYIDYLKLTGQINVDHGSIKIEELADDAIAPSKDIIVVDMEVDKQSASLPIEIDMGLSLGEKLTIDAFGLNTKVTGNLLIRKALQNNVTMHGVLNLVDGSYRSLGQQLVLQNSTVTFQGAPETPYISIEAIRDPNRIQKNITAGVRVTGTPGDFDLVVFSDPVMSQQDALSYVTRGKSLQNSNDSSG